MTSYPRIAIVGAGPGGLTLARILHQGGVSVTVFEREEHALARPQGGTLDLHLESGQLALRRAGLYDEFLTIARYEDQGNRIYDKDGTLLFADDDAGDSERPEVDRTALRQILLASLPKEIICWNHSLREVLPRDDGTYDLVFENATIGPFDLVIGADGSWSKVRSLVSSYRPQYSGITFIEFGIDDVDTRHPDLAAFVGHGKIDIKAAGKGLTIQRNGNAHLRGYAIFRVPTDWADETFDFASPAKARTRLAAEFQGWAPSIVKLVEASNDHIVSRPIYALPVGHHWQNRIGITLLGDAAHVMSPFGGDGVNVAMLDAAELARHLLESDDWEKAVRTYEADMFERVIEPAEHAAEAVATELSHLEAEPLLQFYRAHLEVRQQGSTA
ncbi:NAD(P)/FAD-dependent oxidoreductase [Rhizobium sp. BK602]|uniref:FAD-dependent oxidoreductase n=1 Tax=Rhizobium sp. BK602 TaxID=2586986 RepID=UPI001618052D|nr:NAD(P)/FAD-dependent oxidoreductase [Rhizobium sp. BK602]